MNPKANRQIRDELATSCQHQNSLKPQPIGQLRGNHGEQEHAGNEDEREEDWREGAEGGEGRKGGGEARKAPVAGKAARRGMRLVVKATGMGRQAREMLR